MRPSSRATTEPLRHLFVRLRWRCRAGMLYVPSSDELAQYVGSNTLMTIANNVFVEVWYAAVRGFVIALAQMHVCLARLPREDRGRRFWLGYVPIKLLSGFFVPLLTRKIVVDLFLTQRLAFGMSGMTLFYDTVAKGNGFAVTPLDCLNGVADEDLCLVLHENATVRADGAGTGCQTTHPDVARDPVQTRHVRCRSILILICRVWQSTRSPTASRGRRLRSGGRGMMFSTAARITGCGRRRRVTLPDDPTVASPGYPVPPLPPRAPEMHAAKT